jgi:hypothetical protein
MSKGSDLSGLKGYRRTFAVHSNSGANAAVAAMAVLLGRNQERGPFFRFSEALNPPEDLGTASTDATESTTSDLIADFKSDWAEFLYQHALPACGVKVRKRELEIDTLGYLNAYGRRIPAPKPRAIHESRELSIPNSHKNDYEALKMLVSSGADLRPYLSRDILSKKCPDRNDGLLNAWGIQHLHFKKTGTKDVLFCRITESDVYMIQVLPHDDDRVWVDTNLLQIMHDNWPEELSAGRLQGIPPEVFSTEKRQSLRKRNANFISPMPDGTVYLAPGGGMMSSGHAADDQVACDKIFTEIEQIQKVVMASAANIRAALNWPQNKIISIKMMFDHHDYCLYEPTTRTRIKLNVPNDIPGAEIENPGRVAQV